MLAHTSHSAPPNIPEKSKQLPTCHFGLLGECKRFTSLVCFPSRCATNLLFVGTCGGRAGAPPGQLDKSNHVMLSMAPLAGS